MSKIKKMDDFLKLISNIKCFSHAYLINTNSLDLSYKYVLELTKMIICGHNYNNEKYNDICYKIDNNEYEDLYIIKNDSLSINNDDIVNLLKYMETKSLVIDGKRVYIIFGFEKVSTLLSNKILKFLEEPSDNIYALLVTENIDGLLPTIVSRCQTINLTFDIDNYDTELILLMKKFLINIYEKKEKCIAYINEIFEDKVTDRLWMYNSFEVLEKILCYNIEVLYEKKDKNNELFIEEFNKLDSSKLINILNITNKLKILIKNNINLNLLVDRYIIETAKEFYLCKE